MRRARTGGFTLLELVVTLAVMAVVFTGLYGVFSGAINAAESAETVTVLEDAGRLVTDQINHDLTFVYHDPAEQNANATGNATEDNATDANATSALPAEGNATEETSFDIGVTATLSRFATVDEAPDAYERATLLDFTTTSSLDFSGQFPSRRIARVQYVMEPMEEAPGRDETRYRLIRRELAFASAEYIVEREEDLPWIEIEMADNVRAFSLSYAEAYDPGEEEQGRIERAATWDAWKRTEGKFVLPAAVFVSLELEMKGRTRIFTVTSLPGEFE